MPYPLPLTRTEAYLAYKAGVVQLSDLKPSLAVPRNGIDAWLAYWTGLAADYPKRDDGTPHILQEEEAYIAYLCGVIDTYPEKCLRRVGAYLRYIISARWGRPDHPLNREELYLSLIKTQFIPSGDPSSDITIEGTCKAPFQDVKMYGDTFQQTYTGKNLFNVEAIPYVPKRAYSSTGEVYSWTDYVGTDEYQPVEPNTQYTLWNNKIGNTTYLCEYDENKNFIRRLVAVMTFTTTATTKYLRWSLNAGTGEIPPTRTQLELGSTATSYEPYVGGQPSPSPDFPQQIQTVTGEQTVTVDGKNLLNLADKTATERGVSINMSNGNVLSLDGTATSTGDSFYYYSANIKITQDSVLSGNVLGGTAVDGALLALKLRIQRSDGTGYWTSIKVGEQMQLHEGLTIAQFYLGLTSGTVFTNYKVGIQLEKGSTASAYTPYSSTNYPISLGSLELCKLGTYQDYIWKDGDDWKVHKATKKVELDEQSGWTKNQYGTNAYKVIAQDISTLQTTVCVASQFFIGVSYDGRIATTQNIVFADSQPGIQASDRGISIRNTPWSDTTSLLAWVASNQIIVYYLLLTPTDTTITDQTLIAQLDALVNGGAEDGTTYIKVNATDPNLPGLLYVEAPKYE